MTLQSTNPNPRDLINQVANFYKQYLNCSPEQLDLLALWTMHTHIIPGAPFSPSLNICSREKHSGKTLCLQLLGLLCDGAWMHTAAAPSLLIHQLTDGDEPFGGTLLLDDCDATFGKTRMNIKLQGLFTARFQQDARFTVRVKDDGEYIFDDRLVFFPAAFAGHGRLHPCLAERSIQIALEPKKAGSPCQPFRFYAAQNQSRSLQYDLSGWGNTHHEHFEKIAPYKDDQFPPELSWRHRDCAEPLLHVADFIGGDWPQRARQALVNAFALAAFEDFYNSKQILSDIRDAFFEKGNPEWLSSADVLEFLHTMDNRPWDDWIKGKPLQPKALSHLLEPFGIGPRNHRTGPQTVPKGYYRADLEPAWQRHLPETQTKTEACGTAAPGCGEGILRSPAMPVAVELQNSALSTPKLTASSQKPVAPPVAADLQNSTPGNSQREPVLTSQPKESVATPTSVAANLQNSISNTPKHRPSNEKLAASTMPVAAELQNSAPINPKPVDSHKLAATSNPVAADLQDSTLSRSRLEHLLRYQPKVASSQKPVAPPVAANLQNSVPINPKPASSQKLVAPPVAANLQNSVPNGPRPAAYPPIPNHFGAVKPSIGERILALPRPVPGGSPQTPDY